MNAVLVIAAKEIRDGFRNRWIIGATLVLAALAFALALLGSTPTGTLAVKPLAVTVVSLASLSIFLLPLIALLLAYDTVVGEVERGTMLLLLTYPVTRNQFLLGKMLGHCAILALATVIGYGGAGLAVGLGQGGDAESWGAFALLLGTSVMLGAAFVAMATLASLLVRERGTAAGISVAIWLLFVVVFDLGMLGLLVAGNDLLPTAAFGWLLMLNPADVYRLANLTGFDNVRIFSGMAGAAAELAFPPNVLLAVLAAWVAAPMAAALLIFRRREL
ncbi:MAG TPA: ABC transporter permease subunit [Candidatus Omnitrophota bacterium]|nr:ABC transporter permease subunit [Candidatus Omnitrophota bacterium]